MPKRTTTSTKTSTKTNGTAARWRDNDPPALILTSLASGPKHGYALLLDIESFASVRLGPGTLYGAISRLEERGLIEPVASEGRARPYRLTTAGSEELVATLEAWRAIIVEGTTRLHARTAVERPGLV
jgi:DNA-binding PadR family transcriptional regulator